jgi:gliding motility-associated-like protein
LDAVEAPDCYYTSAEWLSGSRMDIKVTTSLAMSATYNAPNELVDGDNGVALANVAVNFTATSTAAPTTVYNFEMPMSVQLDTVFLGYINTNSHFNAGTVLKLQGSNDNNTWTDLNTGLTYTTTNNTALVNGTTSIPSIGTVAGANIFPVTQNAGKYQYYRIYWVSGGGINASGYSNEAYFSTNTTYVPSANPKLSCTTDTDGDSILNHLDLDSDNDGCVDAIEGGASILPTQLVSAGGIATVGTGSTASNQNLCGGTTCVSTSGSNIGLPQLTSPTNYSNTTGQTINTSQDSLVNTCLDSDEDGYPDDIDLDDDNDGILDVVENVYTPLPCNTVTTVTEIEELDQDLNIQIQVGDLEIATKLVNCDANGNNCYPAGYDPFTNTTYADAYLDYDPTTNSYRWMPYNFNDPAMAGPVPLPTSTLEFTMTNTGTDSIAEIMHSRVQTNNSPWTPNYSDVMWSWDPTYWQVSIESNNGTFPVGTILSPDTWYSVAEIGLNAILKWEPLRYLAPGETITFTQSQKWISSGGVAQNMNHEAMRIDFEQCNSIANPSTDIDGDGIPNYLDLDTDGDGCPDAIEGGAPLGNANLETSNMPGGNTGTNYIGITTNPITVNLGNTVDTNGVPTIAIPPSYTSYGQSLGTSQNVLAQDSACCDAGYVAPLVVYTDSTIVCPNSININSLIPIVSNSAAYTAVWSLHNPPSSSVDTLPYTQTTNISTSGKYYVYYRSKSTGCFSPGDSINIILICIDPDYDSGTVTTLGGIAIADITDNDSINGIPAVIGVNASISVVGTWQAGITLDTLTGQVSVAPNTPVGAYPISYQLCDTFTPQTCTIQIDTVYVVPYICPPSSAPVISGATLLSGTATYVPTVIETSTLTSNGGTFTVTYHKSSETTGDDPISAGFSAYPDSFIQTFNLSDIIPTDAIADPKPNFIYTWNVSGNGTTGGLDALKISLHIDPQATTILSKNIDWDNTAFGNDFSIIEPYLKNIYDNTVSGVSGTGPLTTPTYIANTSIDTPLNGNLVTSLQYVVTSGTQSSLGNFYIYPSGATWEHANSGSGSGGTPINNFAKTWSFDEIIQGYAEHAQNESSTAEIVFAVKDAPYEKTGFGVTNDIKPRNQVLQFSASSLTVSNTCPDTTVNLNALVSSSTPLGDTLVWYTNSTHTGPAYPTPDSAKTGTYYGFYLDTTTNCFSDVSTQINVIINFCSLVDPDYDSGTVSTITGGVAIANVTSNDSINGQPVTLGTGGNGIIKAISFPTGITLDTTNGAIIVAPGTPIGAYPITYSLCDTFNPQTCVNQIDTVYVICSTVTTTQTITVCYGDSITVCGVVHSATGNYSDTCIDVNGCDSVVITNLTVRPLNTTTQTITLCYGDSITVCGTVHSATGNYSDTCIDVNGCDSVVVTNLTVRPLNTTTQTITLCYGDSITVCGTVHSATGNYSDTCIDVNGCDSVVVTNLTVRPLNTTTQTITLCYGDSITVCGTVHSATGNYSDTCIDVNGCDSVVITNLTVRPLNTTTQTITVCYGDSITVCGTVHSATGNYSDTCIDVNGCDSVVVTNLTVNNIDTINLIRTLCDGSVIVGMNTYTKPGIYRDTLNNITGCDSIIILNLFDCPVIPVCDTCTETTCLDTIVDITDGTWTLCDGSTTATSGLGTYSIDSTTGCITYTSNGIIGRDTLCIIVCDSTKEVCDTITVVVPIIPTPEVITDTITIGTTDSVCVQIEEGMNADSVSIVNCDGTLDNITAPTTTVNGNCVNVTYTGTNIGTDKFCVVVCDTVLDICDTTEVIVTVIPKDTVPVIPVCDTCTETTCLDTIFDITDGHWTLCDGSQTATSGLGTYSIDSTTGCITYTATGIIGRDTLCIIVCDSTKEVCDTIPVVVVITPTPEVITDTITIGTTDSVCVQIEAGMNADSVSIVNCDGTLDNITAPTTTVNGNCVNVTYTGTNIGTDKFCVVVCDTVLDICDTTEVIVTVIPKDTVIVIPVCDTCTETTCLDTIVDITDGTWTLCDGSTTATSGLGTYSIDSTTGCITYTSNGIIGKDTLCIIVCDSTKEVCDTITVVVPIIPTPEVITDTITIGTTDSVCVQIEEGMNADSVSIVNCDGTLDNITAPTTTVNGNCVNVTYTGTNIGTDKFCVVVCDTVLDICDTTEVIVTVIPKDTVPVIPVCDTCTETTCLDTIVDITDGTWTLCDGSTTATSGLGTYSIDSTTGCITYTSNGIIGRDTLCIIVCDSTKEVCDTITVVVPIIPTPEVITDTITIGTTDSVCVQIEEGMNADSVSIVNCDGTLDNITAPTTTVNGNCVSVSYTGTNIGTDKFCVVVCDTVLDICDTTEVIVTVIPKDTVPVIPVCDTCTETTCLDTIFDITDGHWTLCDGSQTATSGLGTYSIDSTTGCITYTSNGIIGRDTLCIIVCDSTKEVCDTITVVVPIIPTPEVITDTITIGTTDSVCVQIEEGMNADSVSIVNCDGTLDNITAPTTTVNGNCVNVTYTGTNIGTDKFCVVVCDTVLDICDTTEVIITVIPKDTVPVIPVCDTCTETTCLDTIFDITDGHWTLCDGSQTATSGLGTYSIDSTTGCITYTATGIIGRDTLCIIVCDSTKEVCDTIPVVVVITPTPEVITDTITIGTTDSVCVQIEAGMNADSVSIVNCDGTLDNITAPTTTVNGNCVNVTYTGTNIGTDKFCVVVCDTVLDICDTTEVIVTVIPKDTVIVIPVCDTCTETTCLDTIVDITDGTWTLCDGSTTATSGLGTYSIDSTTGCITYTSNGIIGKDTLCIIVCDSTKEVCDTITVVVPIIPTPEVITDTITIGTTDSVCVQIEEGMNADSVSIVNCDGTLDNITAPTTTVNGNCVNVTYTGTNIGTDKFCVVVCDTVLDICDTTEVIVTVIPKDTVPVIPVCDTCTETTCLDTIVDITDGTWTLCDGSTTATSGLGTYSIDSTTGCITYTSNGIIGKDTLCIIVCDSTKEVCDTITVVVPIIPTPEVIRDTNIINSIDTLCLPIELGMSNIKTEISNCRGELWTNSYTLGTDGCIVIDRSRLVGFNLDTLCIIKTDTITGIKDTTVAIISNISVECDSVIESTYVEIPCDNGEGKYCLPIALIDLSNYNVYIDATKINTLDLSGCNYDTTAGYDFSTHILSGGYSNSVLHRLDSVKIDGVRYGPFTYTTYTELRDYLNSINPAGAWVVDGDRIAGGRRGGIYGDMRIVSLNTGVRHWVGYNINELPKGSELTIPSGCHWVVVESKENGCRDSVRVCVVGCTTRDTIRDTTCYGCPTEFCVDTTELPGNVVSITTCAGDNKITIDGLNPCVIYRPETGQLGSDTTCIIVCDDRGYCDTTTIIITVLSPKDTLLDTLPVMSIDSICDFIHPSGSSITTTSCNGETSGVEAYISWTINGEGCLVYSSGSTKGTDTLCIKTCITGTDTCFETVVYVSVTGIPPVAVNNDTSTQVGVAVVINVLGNDIKTDSDPLMLCPDAIITQPTNGTIGSIDLATGAIEYIPNSNYTGLDSFQYVICDPEGKDTAWVYVRIVRDNECELLNAFSPNGDGVNDTYTIPCPSDGAIVLCVYNRWGIEVYRNEDYKGEWDGRYKGSPLPDGTYYYVIKYQNSDGAQINKAGFIVIHR